MSDEVSLAIIGIIIALIGVFLLVRQSRKKEQGLQVEATVVDMLSETDTSGGDFSPSHSYTSFFPVYEYTVNGEYFKRKSLVGTGKPSCEVGEKVIIRCDPQNPGKIYTKADAQAGYFLAGVLVFVGAFTVIFCLL